MPHEQELRRVFISYSRKDGGDIAAKLRKRLDAEGILLWQDLVAIEAGLDWWRQIQQAIKKAEYLVLVLTPEALASEFCAKEWRYARQVATHLIPVSDVAPATLNSPVLQDGCDASISCRSATRTRCAGCSNN